MSSVSGHFIHYHVLFHQHRNGYLPHPMEPQITDCIDSIITACKFENYSYQEYSISGFR